ncbi:hypothetical protein [Candidatus Paracaedibacter symbiosus]|uniref:hypothetical protein n=1 Tax=Candidatus Paracaedibacter symbiosus TaxID=244582 RepID=UPI0005095B3F|nr:hypothetical protein [Candidatus Paracaedibacter symbiosus]
MWKKRGEVTELDVSSHKQMSVYKTDNELVNLAILEVKIDSFKVKLNNMQDKDMFSDLGFLFSN